MSSENTDMFSVIEKRFYNYINSLSPSKEQKRVLDLIKLPHTKRVVTITEELARSVLNDEADVELSKIIAQLHDIARWEQIINFNTFSDNECDHGNLGKEITEKINILKGMEESRREIVLTSIMEHNKMYSSGYECKTQLFIDIIKDADRIDNFKVEVENFGYGSSPEKKVELPYSKENKLSEAVFKCIMNGELIESKLRETLIDFRFSKMAWCFDFHIKKSFDIVRGGRFLEIMYSDIKNPDETMNIAFNKILSFVENGGV